MGCIRIDFERCKGCEVCAASCPRKLIAMDANTLNEQGYHPAKYTDENGACKACRICADMCPDMCIVVFK